MERMNYQHLFYFWNVACEGSITRASEKLHLAQPTISSQLSAFEQAIGEKLFYRSGRKLQLTQAGRVVFHYADEIFALGRELHNALSGKLGCQGVRLALGVADALPKMLVYRLIEPVFRLGEQVQVFCHEDKAERLLADISVRGFDLVLSDTPITPASGSKAFNHLLGESGVSVFGTPELAAQYRQDFPRSLMDAPFLLPTGNTVLRRSLDQWFDQQGIAPKIVAELEDSSLMKTFGGGGIGLFVAPTSVDAEIRRQYAVEPAGRIDAVQERFYAITMQKKQLNPAVAAILLNAGRTLNKTS